MTRRYITRTGRSVEERPDTFHETLAPAPHYYAVEETNYRNDRQRAVSGLELFVSWVAGILNTLLALRFFLSLLNANQGNGFVSFIYHATNGLVAPFANLFNYQVSSGVGYFDLPAVAAIVVVSLIAWGANRLLRIGRV